MCTSAMDLDMQRCKRISSFPAEFLRMFPTHSTEDSKPDAVSRAIKDPPPAVICLSELICQNAKSVDSSEWSRSVKENAKRTSRYVYHNLGFRVTI